MAFHISPPICVREPCFGCKNCIEYKVKNAIEKTNDLINEFNNQAFERLRSDIKFIIDSTLKR